MQPVPRDYHQVVQRWFRDLIILNWNRIVGGRILFRFRNKNAKLQITYQHRNRM